MWLTVPEIMYDKYVELLSHLVSALHVEDAKEDIFFIPYRHSAYPGMQFEFHVHNIKGPERLPTVGMGLRTFYSLLQVSNYIALRLLEIWPELEPTSDTDKFSNEFVWSKGVKF